MYPFLRSYLGNRRARRMPRLRPFDMHLSRHRIWPFDIDPWLELNNGRTLTLYDLGRLPLYERTGLLKAVRDAGMYFTVAGVSVRYRARIVPFSIVDMQSRIVGYDGRFFYAVQSLWQGEACANEALIRVAVARRGKGIVPPAEVMALIGHHGDSPPLPEWVRNWATAEATRPWPPERVVA